jgi:hypothetical protein
VSRLEDLQSLAPQDAGHRIPGVMHNHNDHVVAGGHFVEQAGRSGDGMLLGKAENRAWVRSEPS